MATTYAIDRALSEPSASLSPLDVQLDQVDEFRITDLLGRKAALWVTDQVVARHGCDADPRSGKPCSKPQHAQDMADASLWIDMLGLIAPAAKPLPARQPAKPKEPRPRGLIDALAWTDRAACKGEPLVAFFGYDGERGEARQTREEYAKSFCGWCPVRSDCLDWAITGRERGIWGGVNDEERDPERRRRLRRKSEGRAV